MGHSDTGAGVSTISLRCRATSRTGPDRAARARWRVHPTTANVSRSAAEALKPRSPPVSSRTASGSVDRARDLQAPGKEQQDGYQRVQRASSDTRGAPSRSAHTSKSGSFRDAAVVQAR